MDRERLCILQKECTRIEAERDKVNHFLAYGRRFFPAFSTTKTGRNHVAEFGVKIQTNKPKRGHVL